MKVLRIAFLIICILNLGVLFGQKKVTFGLGNIKNVSVSSSSQDATGIRTLTSLGYFPNYNSSSRFLSQATLGANYAEIQKVTNLGIEKWLDNQLNLPNSFSIENYVFNLHQSTLG